MIHFFSAGIFDDILLPSHLMPVLLSIEFLEYPPLPSAFIDITLLSPIT